MDLQTYLDNTIKSERAVRVGRGDQLTLGEIILKLEAINPKGKDKEPDVVFDFEYLFPTGIDSWRGAYDELALGFSGYSEGRNPMTISQFLALLKNCYERTFFGYKGGEYTMGKTTPVWVANYGNSGNTVVLDVVDNEYQVILITGYREY